MKTFGIIKIRNFQIMNMNKSTRASMKYLRAFAQLENRRVTYPSFKLLNLYIIP